MGFRYSIAEIAASCGGAVVQPGLPETVIRNVLTDSRLHHIPNDSMFVALKGERHDGHRFLNTLCDRGIVAILVSEVPAVANLFPEVAVIVVKDTLRALQQLAAIHRSGFQYPVIGITGSNGKTIVKEWLANLLGEEYNVFRSPLSYNSQVGVPLSLIRMNNSHTLALIEAGISMPGEMDLLKQMIQPTVGVFTGIGPAHDAFFPDRTTKIKEKVKLFTDCSVVVCFSDLPEVLRELSESSSGNQRKIFTIGYRDEDDVQILNPPDNLQGPFGIVHLGARFSFDLPFTDHASVRNALLGSAVMFQMGYHGQEIAKRLKRLEPVAMRMEQLEGINGCVIINDSYNSDLLSVQIAFEHLARNNSRRAKCMILSDIFQTGLPQDELAVKIAEMVEQYQPDHFVGIGSGISLLSKRVQASNSWFYETTDQFLKYHPFSVFRDEVIFLKGARSFGFERIRDALQRKSHETVLETNLDAIAHNLNVFRSLVQPGTKMMAMVKASSYGSGSFEIAGVLQFHQVDYLAVAYVDEGVELRNAGIRLPIMVMSPETGGFNTMVTHHLEPEIYSPVLLDKFLHTLEHDFPAMPEAYPIHIEVDTGMHRLGFSTDEIFPIIQKVNASGRVRIASVFSHLATAGDSGPFSFAHEQIGIFRKVRDQILQQAGWQPPPLFHILNSDGIVNFPDAAFDMVRPGIGLYGFVNHPEVSLRLSNASTLKTVLTQVRSIGVGQSVGYNRAFSASEEMLVGTVAIGYADGFNRKLGNGNYQLRIRGEYVPVIGDVCMDMLMVDLTKVPHAQVGDEVVVFDQQRPVTVMAKKLGTIPYEILTSVSPRVKRVYVIE